MKLVLYSGGGEVENLRLNLEFVKLFKKKNPVITFIPSSSYQSDSEFQDFVNYFSKYNFSRFIFFPVDVPFDNVLMNQVMQSDAIFLAGGNTFYFLNSLRKSKLILPLKRFVSNGGILSGLSAGAIMMTEDISLAGYPEFDRDVNDLQLKNLNSLGLVDFYFFPHFKNSLRYDLAFKKFSKKNDKILYACPDGAGLVISDDSITFVGKCMAYYKGKKMIINN